MSNFVNEMSKGFGRGLGYNAASIITNAAISSSINKQEKELNELQEIGQGNFVKNSTNLSCWFWILSIFFIHISLFVIPIYGIFRYNKKTISAKRVVVNETYISDRRYKCGYRTEYVRRIETTNLPATNDEIKIFKKQGKLMMIPGIIILSLFIILFMCAAITTT